MLEIWKPIQDYEGLYEISNLGNARSLNFHREGKTRLLKQKETRDGYLETTLSKNGKPKYIRTHRLVAMAFCENPNNKPEINHIDGNKHNNSANNLEWCTSSENQKHAYKLGLQKVNGGAITNKKKIKCIELNIVAESLHEMQRILFARGLTKSVRLNRLSAIVNSDNKRYLGLTFDILQGEKV